MEGKKPNIVSIIIILIIILAIAYLMIKGQKPASTDNANTINSMDTQQTPPDNTAVDTGSAPQAGSTKTLPDGLQITIEKEGTGEVAKVGSTVSVNYVGTFSDGTKFDASADHGGTPVDFPIGVGAVIKGWDEGVVGMKVGEKRKLFIPWALAYGDAGRPPVIPAKADLIFEIELVAVK